MAVVAEVAVKSSEKGVQVDVLVAVESVNV
jgi:hypothetical protein